MTRRDELIERLWRLRAELAERPDQAREVSQILALAETLDTADPSPAKPPETLSSQDDDSALTARAVEEFLAILGHELRNGLAPILAALQARRTQERAQAREDAILEHHTWQLARLADDLLDLSLLKQRRMILERSFVTLQDILARAIEVASPLIVRRRQVLSCGASDEALNVHGDRRRLIQVFANLLTNAAKYTPEEGSITITIEATEQELVVRISDSGIGIEPAELPRIFELFSRGKHASGESGGGLGVGLALVRNIVELHVGSVEATSPGRGLGATFRVRLPRATSSDPGELARVVCEGAVSKLRGARILVVDDNEDAAELLAESLVNSGCETRIVHDGESALALARDFRPSVTLLDLGLPGIDGYDVARRLRAEPGLASMKLIAVTGYGRKSNLEKTRDSGFDAHVVKPFDMAHLLALLAQGADAAD